MSILKNSTIALLGTLATFGFTACKKTYSPDDPLPTVYESSIYAATNNRKVYAIDPATGTKRWEAPVNTDVAATPVVVGDKLYVVDKAGRIYRINPISGKVEDSKNLGGAVLGTPLETDGRLLIGIGDSMKLIAPGDFSVIWSKHAAAPITTSPAINTIGTDTVKTVFFTAGNRILALRLRDGQQTWSVSPSGAGIFASSVSVPNNGHLYVGNNNGRIYAIKMLDGSLVWSYLTGAAISSSPISIGGNVMVGSFDHYLYSIDSATGLLRWKAEATDRIMSSPFVDNQNIYFGSNDFYMYCVNIIDGTLKWKTLSFGAITASPFVHNKVLYFNSFDNNVYAVDAETGEQKWVYNTNATMTSSLILDLVGSTVVPSISGKYPY